MSLRIIACLYLLSHLGILSAQSLPESHLVRRVIDGDTLELQNGERVRLIGVDTPEKNQPGSYEATRFVRGMVQGRQVRLEFDPASARGQYRDYFGRLLAYVFVDGVLVNAEIIRQGHGRAYTRYRFAYREWFRALAAD